MKVRISGVNIRGITAELPERRMAIDELADVFGERKVRRIQRNTGVHAVHVLGDGVAASDLCEAAARRLLKELDVHPEEVDGIVYSSFAPDRLSPATSISLQSRLGLPKSAVAMDIVYGCSGYIYGLYQASLLLMAGGCHRVLLCTAGGNTRVVHERDFALRVITGDAGSATLLERGEDGISFALQCDGSRSDVLMIPAGGQRLPRSAATAEEQTDAQGNVRTQENLRMDGMAVMEFALTEVPGAVKDACELSGISQSDIQLYAMHQPNAMILQHLQLSLNADDEKMPIGLRETGNTSAASIPLLLSVLKHRGKDLSKVRHAMLCGFGIGLSLGAAELDLSKTVVLPVERMASSEGREVFA